MVPLLLANYGAAGFDPAFACIAASMSPRKSFT